jgi:hypothetical protein
MLTSEDREEIKRIVGEEMSKYSLQDVPRDTAAGPESASDRPSRPRKLLTATIFRNGPLADIETRDLAIEGFAEIRARAIEVFGNRDKALHWLKTPVASLDGKTPISMLGDPAGIARVLDTLGQVEHGVW